MNKIQIRKRFQRQIEKIWRTFIADVMKFALKETGWLHLESGMAIALKKPIFVLCQKDIHSDGIFDRAWNTYLPIEIESPLYVSQPNITMMLQKIEEFVANYKG